MRLAFHRLERDWTGRRVFLLGGGPSLQGFEFERLRGRGTVVAINDAIFAAPWADVAFSIDSVWVRRRREDLARFAGETIAAIRPGSPGLFVPRIKYLSRISSPGLSRDPSELCSGFNSGFGALGLALQRGASEIFLLGYDMNGAGHFHKGYEWDCRFGVKEYPTWSRLFSTLEEPAKANGSAVFNCNPESAIRCFPFASIDQVLANDDPSLYRLRA
jgi:hypothetical protein